MEQVKRVSTNYFSSNDNSLLNNKNQNNNVLNSIVFDEKSVRINQKLNSFIHTQLKEKIGLRKYLYDIQNLVFTAIDKTTMGVICEKQQMAENIYNKYHFQISKILYDTWKKASILLKYFYIDSGELKEIITETKFVETSNTEIVYFDDKKAKQTFDNFVSSEENITALEVCQSIACYSQKEIVSEGSVVFLYGETGCGKTHLMNAINNYYSGKGGSVICISANNFLRQYIEAVQKQNVFLFQDSLLKNEIIIIEDIDELMGKNGTLTELNKIIELATNDKKYVILTSKMTKNVLTEKGLSFKNILSNAVSLKIGSSKEALKMNIATNYICENNINIPISVVSGLIKHFDCDVRELKNYIKKLSIIQSIKKFELNTNLALEILCDDVKVKLFENKATNEEIIKIVSDYYCINKNDLSSKIKSANICKARNVAIYLMREINSANLQEIGRILNRNHSTIISCLKNIERMLEEDKKIPAEIADLREKLKSKIIF